MCRYGNRAGGGGSGIRTHDTVSRIHTFQACAFDRSAIPPSRRRRWRAAMETKSVSLGAEPPDPPAERQGHPTDKRPSVTALFEAAVGESRYPDVFWLKQRQSENAGSPSDALASREHGH
jgi:hypothetical protein